MSGDLGQEGRRPTSNARPSALANLNRFKNDLFFLTKLRCLFSNQP